MRMEMMRIRMRMRRHRVSPGDRESHRKRQLLGRAIHMAPWRGEWVGEVATASATASASSAASLLRDKKERARQQVGEGRVPVWGRAMGVRYTGTSRHEREREREREGALGSTSTSTHLPVVVAWRAARARGGKEQIRSGRAVLRACHARPWASGGLLQEVAGWGVVRVGAGEPVRARVGAV